ncbi:sialidase family protein [Cognatilysobacter bugurensis]|uniref:Exo-alpha-sialidase n=1 Tax=Cognatilysobacter bugurensis TaxID=543356 RepID=A0A918W8Z3_9GAMM|nr:sialidase family protein [Lysobacter bugurensis]GHA87935.1 hypothetical protein GCM10007067_27470 [Lysobacter bugurensis]
MHLKNPFLAAALVACVLSGCERGAPSTGTAAPAARVEPALPADIALVASKWTLPAPPGAAQPDLVRAPDGSLLLSWLEREGDAHALKFARWRDGAWTAPQLIARGTRWFVNWADTPHVAQTADGALWAHWLEKTADAPYAYDVVLVRSADGGATWSAPVRVNDDGTPTEHGFVSLWPAAHDTLGIAWLDGRRTAGAGGHEAHAGHGTGAMTLRSARFDAALARTQERELDLSTCDCCQTDVAVAATGPVLAYRDRTADEIRDIRIAALDDTFQPHLVHADNWRMPACPVNGPSIDANARDVLVGWYTATGDTPTLRFARSSDGGATFGAPVTPERDPGVLGRVDVALGDTAAWLLWLREDDRVQTLHLARYGHEPTATPQRIVLASLQGRGRGTGFPRLVRDGDGMRAVWTDLVDGEARLEGAVVSTSTVTPPSAVAAR